MLHISTLVFGRLMDYMRNLRIQRHEHLDQLNQRSKCSRNFPNKYQFFNYLYC